MNITKSHLLLFVYSFNFLPHVEAFWLRHWRMTRHFFCSVPSPNFSLIVSASVDRSEQLKQNNSDNSKFFTAKLRLTQMIQYFLDNLFSINARQWTIKHLFTTSHEVINKNSLFDIIKVIWSWHNHTSHNQTIIIKQDSKLATIFVDRWSYTSLLYTFFKTRY